uniref:Uncharacterized protein n=1 Tax=Arundo donax TaxID=35708 RepID=A0A0A8YHU9_ARUDO
MHDVRIGRAHHAGIVVNVIIKCNACHHIVGRPVADVKLKEKTLLHGAFLTRTFSFRSQKVTVIPSLVPEHYRIQDHVVWNEMILRHRVLTFPVIHCCIPIAFFPGKKILLIHRSVDAEEAVEVDSGVDYVAIGQVDEDGTRRAEKTVPTQRLHPR